MAAATLQLQEPNAAAVAFNSDADADDDDFDPFRIGEIVTSTKTRRAASAAAVVATAATAATPPPAAAAATTQPGTSESVVSAPGVSSAALPPKVLVKFKVHEEISSIARISSSQNHDDDSTLNTNSVVDLEGSSHVYVKGTLYAQVVSSDASKNSPFVLASSSSSGQTVQFEMNEQYGRPLKIKSEKHEKELASKAINASIVNVPKEVLSFVNLGTYYIKETVDHMPLLLEQKVIRSRNKIQIAVQVRSKLSNPDDLSSFTIAVTIPGRVNGNSVTILSGDGAWDKWRRVITWEVDHLPKGQSFMVSAKCVLQDENDLNIQKTMEDMNDFVLNSSVVVDEGSGDDNYGSNSNNDNSNDRKKKIALAIDNKKNTSTSNTGLKFPVLLRCHANDKVSTARFHAIEANGHPATISSSLVGQSFQMIHRLN